MKPKIVYENEYIKVVEIGEGIEDVAYILNKSDVRVKIDTNYVWYEIPANSWLGLFSTEYYGTKENPNDSFLNSINCNDVEVKEI